jgi:hypothetical protein
MTANVVAVHGISQQQAGRRQLLPPWEAALRDGVERAVGRGGPVIELDLAYYGDLYLQASPRKGGAVTDLATLDEDEIAFLGEIENELVTDEPDEEIMKGFREVPQPVARLAAWLDRRVGLAGRILFFGDLIQVRRYQREDELAADVRQRVGEALGPHTRIMIGHSLGSVVAYEYLAMEPNHGVETLITLGSPLALRSIKERLRVKGPDGRPRSPTGVTRWVNVLDPRDPVACAGGLSPFWPAVTDEQVDNGDEPHAATRYLGKEVTGQAVVGGLQS